jgi:hypothetical protein
MSAAIQEPSFTVTTDSEIPIPSASGGTKYPHTRAILAAIAVSVKAETGEPADADADGVERINPAIVSRVVALLQHEKEDELKAYLKEAFSIPESMVCFSPSAALVITSGLGRSSARPECAGVDAQAS